jgi:hypothetical protein
MNEIQEFQVTDRQVVAADVRTIVVDCGDERPALGTLIEAGGSLFRVVAYNGLRQLTGQSLGKHGARVGDVVTFGAELAFFPRPSVVLDVAESHWQKQGIAVKPRRATFAELVGVVEPVRVGHVGIDAVAPLVHGGANLIVHSGTGARDLAVKALGGATISVNAGVATHRIEGESAHDELMAWRLGSSWAASLRDEAVDVVLVGRLPVRSDAVVNKEAVEARGLTLAEFVDELLDTLFSTHQAKISTVIHLDVPSGHHLHPILETLKLGNFDAAWFIDERGVPDLKRCFSRAVVGSGASQALSTLEKYFRLEEQQKLGLANPEDDTFETIQKHARALLMPLLDGP